MTDRELLEAAAMAAGVYYWRDGDALMTHGDDPGAFLPWNPLTDDGDALRLAVKLQIDLELVYGLRVSAIPIVDEYEQRCEEPVGNDRYAATRRAIVRAAAAMAKDE